MKSFTFVTGNNNKAKQLRKYLGCSVDYADIDLDEIQSLNLTQIIGHKVHEAYSKLHKPVLVEDVALECSALGRLPGPFIKWFEQEIGNEDICRLLDGKDRNATARCMYGYFDGDTEIFFEGKLEGQIADKPRGSNGFGWDTIFIPKGYIQTRSELTAEEYERTYQLLKPLKAVKDFLTQ